MFSCFLFFFVFFVVCFSSPRLFVCFWLEMAELKKREGEGLLGKEGRELAILLFPLVFGVLSAALGLALPRTHVGRVVAHEPGFADLFLDAESGFEVLADGFQWSEGPAWLPPNNALDLPAGVLFSAVRENKIYFYTQDTTRPGVVVFDEASGCDGDDCRQVCASPTKPVLILFSFVLLCF